ncbi:MAG: hypothetical protein ABIH23_02800 [bacterium]
MAYREDYVDSLRKPTRRAFLQSVGVAASVVAATGTREAHAQGAAKQNLDSGGDTYATHAKGIRILAGQWRPHYPWEHIAWVSPKWPSQDYIWLDFPEAIFTNQGLLYLSHVNPPIPTVFHDLPKVPWRELPNGIAFDRELPNGVRFGGSVTTSGESTVDLEIHLKNGTSEDLTDITLQTCSFLRAIKEFSDYTRGNKFVHVPKSGWIPMTEALTIQQETEKYRVGWRTRGKSVADLPLVVTVSNEAERLFAMTWKEDTLSMISNPHHPCVHADPQFKDLEPGEESTIHGKLIFLEGKLEDFDWEKYI